MKAFLSVFLAGLALYGIHCAKTRLDEWSHAAMACNSEITRLLNAPRLNRNDPTLESRDYLDEADRIAWTLEEVEKLEETRVTILSNKPFRLPLTDSERTELESAERSVAKYRWERSEQEKVAINSAIAARPTPAPPGSWMFERRRGNPLERSPSYR